MAYGYRVTVIFTPSRKQMTATQVIEDKKLSPIVKWAGGKEQELKYIIPNLPERFKAYYEPFVGGGSVFCALTAAHYFINDKSQELIGLYRNVARADNRLFIAVLDEMVDNWGLISQMVPANAVFFVDTYKAYSGSTITEQALKGSLYDFIRQHTDQFDGMFSSISNANTENFIREIKLNLTRKLKRMKVLEGIKHKLPDGDILDNVETALKSAFYMHIRHLYNHADKYALGGELRSALFLFIRNFAYSGMFRYNASGGFNVPYGGIGYNRKNFGRKIAYLNSQPLKDRLSNTVIENLDFEDFFHKHQPGSNDFIFLDPPYDSEFSTYARNVFDQDDHQRLAGYLLNECRAKWMLIIKNTAFISSLYLNKGLNVKYFDKTYLVSFMNRNDKNAEHLLITNY